jgi:hypothetical protein
LLFIINDLEITLCDPTPRCRWDEWEKIGCGAHNLRTLLVSCARRRATKNRLSRMRAAQFRQLMFVQRIQFCEYVLAEPNASYFGILSTRHSTGVLSRHLSQLRPYFRAIRPEYQNTGSTSTPPNVLIPVPKNPITPMPLTTDSLVAPCLHNNARAESLWYPSRLIDNARILKPWKLAPVHVARIENYARIAASPPCQNRP